MASAATVPHGRATWVPPYVPRMTSSAPATPFSGRVLRAGTQMGALLVLRDCPAITPTQAAALLWAMGGYRLHQTHGLVVEANGCRWTLVTVDALVRAGYLEADTDRAWIATRGAFRYFRSVHEFASRQRHAFGLDDDGNDRDPSDD